jgi:ferredoxin
MSPSVFRENDAAGYLEVMDLDTYPEDEVDEAIKYCPVDAISWQEA